MSLERRTRPQVYAGWSNAEKSIGNSGGLFSAFAVDWLERNGVVIAPEYTDTFEIKHSVAVNGFQVGKQAWSKFGQSNPVEGFRQAKMLLDSHREVLFVGAPCQIRGLYAYLGGDNDFLTTIQFPCMGMPPQGFLQKYIQWFSGGQIDSVDSFYAEIPLGNDRSNRYMVCNMADGTNRVEPSGESFFVNAWNRSLCISEYCLSCRESIPPIQADFCWGNFWYLGMIEPFKNAIESKNGRVSMLLTNSEKAECLIPHLQKKMELYQRKYVEAVTGHFMIYSSWREHILFSRICATPARNCFLHDWPVSSFDMLQKEYFGTSMKKRGVAFHIAKHIPKRCKALMWRGIYYMQRAKDKLLGKSHE